MKTPSAILVLSALCSFPVFATEEAAHGDPYRPIGTLDVDKTWVRTGMHPQLTWNIRYPQFIHDIVDITPEGRIVPKQRTEMEVRVVGAAFQSGSTHTPVSVKTKIGAGNSWEPIFLGPDYTVDPTELLCAREVEAGTTIDFSSRAQNANGEWWATRDTLTDNIGIIALKNGDSVPSYAPAYEQGDIASFLSQYISPDKTITIGPRDVIYLAELYSTDPESSYFDMQDVVILVTFSEIEESD